MTSRNSMNLRTAMIVLGTAAWLLSATSQAANGGDAQLAARNVLQPTARPASALVWRAVASSNTSRLDAQQWAARVLSGKSDFPSVASPEVRTAHRVASGSDVQEAARRQILGKPSI